MSLRYFSIFALLLAGIIRSPFYPTPITTVPAHELFYSALGASQIMCAIYLLWQPKRFIAWLGVLLSGSSLTVLVWSWLMDIPFTNTPITTEAPYIIAILADVLACMSLLFYMGHLNKSNRNQMLRTSFGTLFSSAIVGSIVWLSAEIIEPYLPELAHDTVDQFKAFDQVVMLSATEYAWDLPSGFPVPYVPQDNPMTEAKVTLGRYLFYDTRLSGNGTMSCSSCHLQEHAFADGLTVPIGSTGESHVRNSQTLTNIAYNATFTWANPVLTEIERQVVIPLFGEFPVEMGVTGNEAIVLDRFRNDSLYPTLFAAAFPESEDPVTYHHVVQSLSSFVRTMISGDSAYDRFVYQGDREALSDSALRGMDLFLSERFECHHCHGGFNFSLSTRHANTTFSEKPFFNTGLYNINGEGAYPRGNTGVFEITGDPRDMGRFRPPTLRNVELTGPYMHDGSIATLEDVILFYSNGGRAIDTGIYIGDGRENPFKSGFVPGFEITTQEMEDMINFLHSLTDQTFITDPDFSDPFNS